MVKISSDKGVLAHVNKMNVHLSADKSILKVKVRLYTTLI